MDKKIVREELKDIKYYLRHKKELEQFEPSLGKPIAYQLAKKYERAMKQGPSKLMVLYGELYINNRTYEELADIWGYSFQYVARLHNDLVDYLAITLDTIE